MPQTLASGVGFDPRSRTGSDNRPFESSGSSSFDPRSRTGSDCTLLNALTALSKAPDQREPLVMEHRRRLAFRSENEPSYDFKELFLREPSGK